MRLVVADTSPIVYLFSIDHIDILPRLFGKVFMPEDVHRELGHPSAPLKIREWAAHLPAWAELTPVPILDDAALLPLGAGERAAITLAVSLHAGKTRHACPVPYDANRGVHNRKSGLA